MQESGEMYLETILLVSQKKNLVRAIDISDEMKISKPSVSRALGKLKEEGCIAVAESGHISFTEKGLAIAEKIYERHRVITELLISLGVSVDAAVSDACKIEHDISDESFDCIKKHMSMNRVRVDGAICSSAIPVGDITE